MAYPRISGFPSRNFFNGSLGHARRFRNDRPPPLYGPKPIENVAMHSMRLDHGKNCRPIFGFLQPAFGLNDRLASISMKGQPKIPKLPGFVRDIVGDNIERRMDVVFSEASDKPLALARATGKPKEGGISKSSVQRIIAGENGATIDKLELIALALKLSVYQLFIPLLDAHAPYVVPGADADELRLFKARKRKPSPKRPEDRPAL